MRNLIAVLTCLALASGTLRAQAPVLVQPGEPWAQKMFNGVKDHDFGTVPRGAQLKHRFKIKNIYSVPMQITDIQVSCNCLSFSPKTPWTLQPNEEGFLDINMDARRFTGPKNIIMRITVGPQFVSTATIQVTANARADVVFNPGQIDFENTPQGEEKVRMIDVEYAGNMDWRILEVVKNADAPFTVEPQELYRENGRLFNRTNKVGYRLTVKLKASAPAGPFRQELMLKTNDPTSPVLNVVVEGNIQAALRVAPSLVKLPGVHANKLSTSKVVVSGNRPFRIVGVDGGGNDVTVELPAEARTSHLLTLKCRPERPGDFHRQLILRTDLDGAAATVTVDAAVQP
jgi:hypothetical protein